LPIIFSLTISHVFINVFINENVKVVEKYYIEYKDKKFIEEKVKTCGNRIYCLKSDLNIFNHACNLPDYIRVSYNLKENRGLITLYYECNEILKNNYFAFSNFNFPYEGGNLYYIPDNYILEIHLPKFSKIIELYPLDALVEGNKITIAGPRYLDDLKVIYKIENPIGKNIFENFYNFLSNPLIFVFVILIYIIIKLSVKFLDYLLKV